MRFSDGTCYSSRDQFLRLCLERLLAELGAATALEILSPLYALARPWEAFPHREVLEYLEESCVSGRQRGGWQTYRLRRGAAEESNQAQ